MVFRSTIHKCSCFPLQLPTATTSTIITCSQQRVPTRLFSSCSSSTAVGDSSAITTITIQATTRQRQVGRWHEGKQRHTANNHVEQVVLPVAMRQRGSYFLQITSDAANRIVAVPWLACNVVSICSKPLARSCANVAAALGDAEGASSMSDARTADQLR